MAQKFCRCNRDNDNLRCLNYPDMTEDSPSLVGLCEECADNAVYGVDCEHF
jgi:hypothetical protein